MPLLAIPRRRHVVAAREQQAARTIERSQLGFGFATIRDDELAAEACGVPTLRLKLIASYASGGLATHGKELSLGQGLVGHGGRGNDGSSQKGKQHAFHYRFLWSQG